MSAHPATILVADDDPRILRLLRVFLEKAGFRVVLTENGSEAVQQAQEIVPDLILVDVMMPQMDGYEVCRQLRNDTRTSHLPILMLTSRSAVRDKVTGFESGADDYVTKPFDLDELNARIRSLLRRAGEIPVRNPLTGLAGNRLLQEELRHHLQRDEPFALLYIDLDHFKAFNDAYGFVRGDEAIQMLGQLIREVVGACGASGDFIGHIGGDDFAVITRPENAEEICRQLIERFDESILGLYDELDLERGYLRGYDRHGVPHRYPIMTISVGVVTNLGRSFSSLDDLGRAATEMKQYAKRVPGSNYAVDQRGVGQPQVNYLERRGRMPARVIAIGGAEVDLLELLRLEMEKSGHLVRLFHSGGDLLSACEVDPPDMIVMDVVLEDGSVWDICRNLRAIPALQHRPILLLSTDAEDEERAFKLGIDAFLLKPFSLGQFASCMQDLLIRSPNGRQWTEA